MYIKTAQGFSQTLPFSRFSFYFGITNPLQYTFLLQALKGPDSAAEVEKPFFKSITV